jgi:hypothetical protein
MENSTCNSSAIVAYWFIAAELYTVPVPSDGPLFHYSGSQQSCHIAPLRGCSSQGYRSITISSWSVMCLWHQSLFWKIALKHHGGADASGFDGVQTTFLVDWVSRSPPSAAPSLAPLVLSSFVVRCQQVQVYSSLFLDIDSCTPLHCLGRVPCMDSGMRVEAWVTFR